MSDVSLRPIAHNLVVSDVREMSDVSPLKTPVSARPLAFVEPVMSGVVVAVGPHVSRDLVVGSHVVFASLSGTDIGEGTRILHEAQVVGFHEA